MSLFQILDVQVMIASFKFSMNDKQFTRGATAIKREMEVLTRSSCFCSDCVYIHKRLSRGGPRAVSGTWFNKFHLPYINVSGAFRRGGGWGGGTSGSSPVSTMSRAPPPFCSNQPFPYNPPSPSSDSLKSLFQIAPPPPHKLTESP